MNKTADELTEVSQIRVRANAETKSRCARESAGRNFIMGAMDWIGKPEPHARQDIDASLVTPADGKPEETKKALLRRCFKPRPLCETQGGPVKLRLPVLP